MIKYQFFLAIVLGTTVGLVTAAEYPPTTMAHVQIKQQLSKAIKPNPKDNMNLDSLPNKHRAEKLRNRLSLSQQLPQQAPKPPLSTIPLKDQLG